MSHPFGKTKIPNRMIRWFIYTQLLSSAGISNSSLIFIFEAHQPVWTKKSNTLIWSNSQSILICFKLLYYIEFLKYIHILFSHLIWVWRSKIHYLIHESLKWTSEFKPIFPIRSYDTIIWMKFKTPACIDM